MIVYALFLAIYRVYLHPLSQFPGPWYYAASQIPITIQRITGNEVATYARLHERYGLYARVAPGELSTINPVAATDVYGHRNAARQIGKDFKAYYMKNQRGDGTEGLMTASDEDHRRQRKVFAPAFSDRAIREQEGLLKKYTDLFVQKSGEFCEANGRVDLHMFFSFATFDFAADLVFGEGLDHLERMEYHPFLANISGVVKFSAWRRAIRSFDWMDKVFTLLMPKSMIKKRMVHIQFCDDKVAARLRKKNTGHPDMWTLVQEAEGKGEGMTFGEMRQNGFLMLTAATETTSSLMTALAFLLAQHPDKLRKLKDELYKNFTSAEEMTTLTLPRLEYLQACIEEGLRCYPPVPGGLPRRTGPQGAVLDGHVLPPDTVVFYAQSASYHSAIHFARPNEFIPERWLAPPPAEFENDCLEAVQAFSSGSRDCIGKNLAYHEARLLAAKFFFTYDVEICEESWDWMNQKAYIVGLKRPLYAKLRRAKRDANVS
ncbi:cytochrome P450 [Colletotrichum navitas]|uniref:Cytochrome P450 n=1 Tax=Colletotrichum navitas TaxID=681940 RepID=A0AAD8PN64_9PEZI|nr:cytochrome P450 [Colletotrichum navitas]KAK1573271.1 cytochrome P450 [Colletotrichum navitas]